MHYFILLISIKIFLNKISCYLLILRDLKNILIDEDLIIEAV